MSVVVFTGPTLSHAEAARALPGATVLPPAGSGDVYRAARSRPAAIAIIDGAFDQRLGIRHKEVLFALSEGIPVLGAASMGALRAAELAAFGMVGVGAVFGWFRDGFLEDDDEVAVAHADGSAGYAVMSEAMVNVRATCARAVADGVVAPEPATAVVTAGKRLFYPARTWPAILADARAAAGEIARLREWLGPTWQRRVDVKADDARELLALLAAGPPPPVVPSFAFEVTEAFLELRRPIDAELLRPAPTPGRNGS